MAPFEEVTLAPFAEVIDQAPFEEVTLALFAEVIDLASFTEVTELAPSL